jgi:hypothetical protein
MSKLVFAPLKMLRAKGDLSDSAFHAAIAATAEGYAFPTNLDSDPPDKGLAPLSQAGLMRQAVSEDWTESMFFEALDAQEARRKA